MKRFLTSSLLLKFALAFAIIVTSCCFAQASETKNNSKEHKTLLILNAYHEDEPWAAGVIYPITSYLGSRDELTVDIMYLNSAIITDSTVYRQITDRVFSKYDKQRKPSYVIMVGAFCFNLRDRIKATWGDVPILVLGRSAEYGPLEDYFTDNTDKFELSQQKPMADLRDKYNFTSVTVPNYIEENIDLMKRLLPNMDSLVFMSDLVYANKLTSALIQRYLKEKYPKIGYKWLQATDSLSSVHFRQYLEKRELKTGLLLSSWATDVKGMRGFPVLTIKDLRFIGSSSNPVFTMRQSYMQFGAIGGVFADNKALEHEIIKVVDAMISGKSMQEIPFITPKKVNATLDYALLYEYGIPVDRCPAHTVFTNKTPSIWDEHRAAIIVGFIAILLTIVLLWLNNREQRRKIHLLNQYTDFVKVMPIPVQKVKITVTPDGKVKASEIEMSNAAYERLVQDKRIPRDLLHAWDLDFVEQNIPCSGNGGSAEFTYDFTDLGTIFRFIVRALPAKNKRKGGNMQFVVDIFAIDITVRHNMERELQTTVHALNDTMTIAKVIPYRWDVAKDRITFVAYEGFPIHETFNSNPKEGITMEQFLSTIYTDDVAQLREARIKVISGKADKINLEYRITNPNNPEETIWLENHGAVVERDDKGEPTVLAGSLQNITERKENEERMRIALERANESDRLKSAFLANMSHEIRTQLNAIVGFSNMITRTADPKKKQEMAQIINKNNDLLLTLINDVLDLAKIESNTIEINYSLCDVDDLLESISKTMSIRVPENVWMNVTHFTNNCVIRTDPSRLAQVIINLLTNACKFTSKGSITLGYEIREEEGTIYFYVRDTGIGLSKENCERVFQQFVKLNSFAQGTGLGLAICRSLINKMGGEIGVFSQGEGKGCTFWFTLPYEPAEMEITIEHKHIVGNMENVSHLAAETGEEVDEDMPEVPDNDRISILIAEDNPSNYQLLAMMLAPHFNLIHAINGKEAVEMYLECNPDIIISDINMPVMDGYQAVTEIRKLSTTVPIIAVTAYAFASDRMRILNSGFNAYVSKPINEDKMLKVIHEALKERDMGQTAGTDRVFS